MNTAVASGAQALLYKHERTLFAIGLLLSLILWLALIVGTFGVALIYLLLGSVAYLFVHSAFISYLRGTGSRITPEQFPDLQQRVAQCCKTLGMGTVPDAYLLHANGAFNALATRFLGRNFIVLYSDIVDALESEPDALNFYIGHELGHIRRNHLRWGWVLFPASVLPLLGAAYSRAREYTCDLHGLACCSSPEVAARGLGALAAGGRRWRSMDLGKYAGQSASTSGFWMSFHELVSSYPWLVKRMARILPSAQAPRVPGRNALAWLLALFVPRFGLAGGAGSLMVTVAIIGILAAVAIPAYQDYTVRAKIAGALAVGNQATAQVAEFYYRNNAVPKDVAEAGVAPPAAGGPVRSLGIDPKGIVRMELGFSPLQGKTLLLVPSLNAEKRIVWKCASDDIEPRYLPVACRR
jgi:Zn-dependent protease with chaperone function/type II secretory pathway pseudopilin PulG